MPDYFKGTVYWENRMAKNSIFVKSWKNLLSVYMEITQNGEKGIAIKYISVTKLLIEHHESIFRSPLPTLDRFN